MFYFPHQQEEFSCLEWKSNFPDSKAKSDATCHSARQRHGRLRGGKACMYAQPQLRWEEELFPCHCQPYLILLRGVWTYRFHCQLSFFFDRDVSGDHTMWERQLDVIVYFCSYHEKKQLGCVPLIQVCTMYRHSYLKQRTDNFGNTKTQTKWNNPSLISNTYSHKPNLHEVAPSTYTGKPLDLSWAQYRGKSKPHTGLKALDLAHSPEITTKQGSTPRLTIMGSTTRIEGTKPEWR